jgi:hypothetical protein
MGFFDSTRLARMSDGHYCLLRDLGPVKGGKGMKHHEVVVDFTFRGLLGLIHRLKPVRRPSFLQGTVLEDHLHRQTSADDGLRR